jgi:hypothetical protein
MVYAVAPNEKNSMTLPYKLLTICFLALGSTLFSQTLETRNLQKRLQWSTSDAQKTITLEQLTFADAVPVGDFGNLPSIVHREKLKNFGRNIQVSIQTQRSEVVRPTLANGPLAKLDGDWQYTAKITDARGVPYLIVQILPLRKTASGIERLLEADITIQWESGPKPNLRMLDYASQSALSEGSWYKIAIARDGVYKIDKNTFNQLGLNVSELNPQSINIYGNGGDLLPASNLEFRYDDLQKCAIYFQGEEDNVFQDNDYILFYGKGADTWKREINSDTQQSRWRHNKHYYSDSAYYFIRIDDTEPLRIQQAVTTDQPQTHTVSRFQDFQFIETDLYNIGRTGREFFGEQYDINTTGSYSFTMPNLISDTPALLEANLAVRSLGGSSNWTVTVAGNSAQTSPVSTGDGVLSAVATTERLSIPFTPSGSTATVNLQFNKYSNTSEVIGWVDFLRLNATRELTMSGSQMKFRDSLSVGSGNIGLFQLNNAGTVFQLWDITDFINPQRINYTLDGNNLEFKAATSSLHEYIAFANSGYLVPTPKGAVANQNLHGISNIDYVIVAAPIHRAAAETLAEIHTGLGTSTVVISQEEIFNEFSSGNPDVTAIRMLMKMLYDRASGNPDMMPQNLLLFGDGDFSKNKGNAAFNGPNVMVYETSESLSPAWSAVSDDYFVFLSDDDDESSSNLLDAGVGRIPASDASEGTAYVEKVLTYLAQNTTSGGGASCLGVEAQSPFGSWRNLLTFVADDQDGNGGPTEQIHLNDADELSAIVKDRYPEFDVVKIYMDAYKQESTPGGERYPEGEEAIRNRVQNGSLLVTYLGHGGERGWAHERILDLNTIGSWTNNFRLPVFLTATCELARYDDPGVNSAGEILVMNPDGGAIAMLTTTRVVFAGSNMEMDLAFFDVALEDDNINNLTLGMINMLTKNGVNPSNSSKPNFSLLGDPALKMTYPKYEVITAAINDIPIGSFTENLKALQEVKFSGYVADASGNKLTDYNGFIYPTVFDKVTRVYTQNNDFDGSSGVVQEYDVFNKNIFKGKASVVNGDFQFEFVVPYDINYVIDTARVSYYTVAGNKDGHGYSSQFRIGGSLSGAELNRVGPEINLYLNDTLFVSGGLSDTRPILLAKLRDENGINTVGNGIGHDLTAVIDNNSQQPIILNEFYETDLDTYKSGEVRYQLPELAEGNHTLSLKAWDVHNNSSSASIEFVVANSGTIALDHVLNYPNPFTTYTEFMFEHNQVCTSLDVRLQIFTVSGKLVKTIEQQVLQNGYRSQPIPWDGTDDFGDRIGKGVYVYRLEVRNEDGELAEHYEKLVILK